MRLRTRLAALTIGAAAAVTPLAGMPTAGAAPASGESTATAAEAGQELTYFGWFYNQSACVETGWAGYQYGMWYADWICWNNGGYWELWVNSAFT